MATTRLGRSPVYRIITAQVIATFIASALCLAIDQVAAMSALAAGVVGVVPGLYLLGMSLRKLDPGDTGLGNAMKGELGRLVITGCLFALVFVFVKPLDAVVFFATFVVLQMIVVIVPWLEARRMLRHGN